jgi:hypothetical protein
MAERFEKVNVNMSTWKIIRNNIIGGVSWGLGATIGVAIILTVLSLILRQINLIPVVGTFVSDIVNFVSQNNPNLR